MDKKSVIIIGAGIGGITTAIYLAKNGFNVKVYEKHPGPGGRCGQIIREGHRFDLGATIFLMPNIYREIFDSLGLNLEREMNAKPLETIYTLYFDDGTKIPFKSNLNEMQGILNSIEQGSFEKLLFYIAKGYRKLGIAMNKIMKRNFYSLFEFINPKNVLLLIQIETYIKHFAYIKKFFKHPHLRKAFTFQNIYVGQNPMKAPALFSMIPASELVEGSLFPAGGMYSVVEKLLSIAEKEGVEFFFNKQVDEIIIDRNSAKGVRLKDNGVAEADIIVANSDIPYVYNELLPDKKYAKRMNRKKFTCSALVFHWGIDKVYQQLGHHSVFLSDKYESNLKRIFSDKCLADEPSFYVHAPVRTDPSAAPKGQDTLSVIVPVGHIDEKKEQDWTKMRNDAKAFILRQLSRFGLTDLEEHIKFEICYLPNTWKNSYNLTRGATFGSLNHNIMQMGYFRPRNRHKKYHNLYFTGGGTHPGNGIPLVLLSGKLTAERIIKEFGNRI